jgi:hypothetical protein
MNRSPKNTVCCGRLFLALLFLAGCNRNGGGSSDSGELKTPATLEQAAAVLDLSTFPMMPGAEPRERSVGTLSYAMTGDTKKIFEFQREKLRALGWKETSDTNFTDQTGSGTFKRNGFVVSVSVYPGGQDGKLAVFLRDEGNVPFDKLPRPNGTKVVYSGPSTAMYVSEAPVAQTKEECRKLLLAAGWRPYGSAGDTEWFKQNAVRLSATVGSAPAQGGKTMITFGSELMSADLPAPDNAEDLRFAEKELSFESPATKEEVTNFYRQTLGQAKWQPTLEKLVDIDEKPTMIFRNPAKDMITLSFARASEGHSAVALLYQTSAEIDELERQLKAKEPELKAEMKRREAEQAKEFAEAHKPAPKISVSLPSGLDGMEQSADTIKFNVGHGKARALVENLSKQFVADGWKQDVATLDAMAGAISLSKEKMSLTVNYTDTGFTPAEVNISAIGAELESSR